MKKLTLLLSLTFVCLSVVTMSGQNESEKVNQILTELVKDGGEFSRMDFESSLELSDKLFKVSAECIKVDPKNIERQDLYENETHFIWNFRNVEENEMYLIITNKGFKEASCSKQSFREVYLTNKALNNY